MADVFISYAKSDRARVERLDALLNAAGFTTWWDKGLTPGDDFGPVIERRLAEARCVVCLWSETSIGSQWVRAEAIKAHAAGKLIPVRTAAVGWNEIPAPFNVLDTGDAEDGARLVGAVKALLERPAVEPGRWFRLHARSRQELFSWSGIVGAVLTVSANLQGLAHAARWARWLLDHWTEVITSIWGGLLFFLPRPQPLDASLLSIGVFLLMSFASSLRRTDARNRRLHVVACVAAVGAIVSSIYFGTLLRSFAGPDGPLHGTIAMRVTLAVRELADGLLAAHDGLRLSHPALYNVTGLALTLGLYFVPALLAGLMALLLGIAAPRLLGRRVDARVLLGRLLRIIVGVAILVGVAQASGLAERALRVEGSPHPRNARLQEPRSVVTPGCGVAATVPRRAALRRPGFSAIV